MRTFSLIAALAIGLIACSLIGQERVCTPSGCYIVPSVSKSQPQVVESAPVQVLQERSIVVESRKAWRPVRNVVSARPLRKALKWVFCR